MTLVAEPAEIDAVAGELSRAALVAFDLEFVSADRLVPALCLIQIAWLGPHVRLDAPTPAIVAEVPHVRLIDPLAADAAPIVAALASHPLVVAHAPRQDLGLLATRFGATFPGIIDTQLMAAFCGIGEQLGLAALAGELLGLALQKEQQWTAWDRRPLSDAQLAYADADVRHLPAMYAKLAAKLGPRLPWVREESAQIQRDALDAASVTAETAWQQVGGARALDQQAQAALVELAAWRHRVASELDRPFGQVLADKLLVELARTRPGSAGAVRSFKGMSPLAKTRADDIVRALQETRPVHATARTAWRPASPRAQRWAEMLLAIVQVVAEDTGIAPRLLGTRGDAEQFARVADEDGLDATEQLPALATWRRDVIGVAWRGWLSGEVCLVGDAAAPHGVRLLPR